MTLKLVLHSHPTASFTSASMKLHSSCAALQAVELVADRVRAHGVRGLVVDPEVAAAIKEHLFPLATVITPNVPEASAMLGTLYGLRAVGVCERSLDQRCNSRPVLQLPTNG